MLERRVAIEVPALGRIAGREMFAPVLVAKSSIQSTPVQDDGGCAQGDLPFQARDKEIRPGFDLYQGGSVRPPAILELWAS